MLPGKKYRPEDVLAILRKRFWLLIVPFAVVSALTAAVARKWPDSYKSEAVIRVTQLQTAAHFRLSPVRGCPCACQGNKT